MTDRFRCKVAVRYRKLLDMGMTRKMAQLKLRDEVRSVNPLLPFSKTQLYRWCAKFKVSTR